MSEQPQSQMLTFDELDALIDRALSSGPPTQLEMVSIRQIALKVERGRQAARAGPGDSQDDGGSPPAGGDGAAEATQDLTHSATDT